VKIYYDLTVKVRRRDVLNGRFENIFLHKLNQWVPPTEITDDMVKQTDTSSTPRRKNAIKRAAVEDPQPGRIKAHKQGRVEFNIGKPPSGLESSPRSCSSVVEQLNRYSPLGTPNGNLQTRNNQVRITFVFFFDVDSTVTGIQMYRLKLMMIWSEQEMTLKRILTAHHQART
jgi:hypothetical protein